AAQPAPTRAASLAALSDAKQLQALAAYVKSAGGATVLPGQAAAAFEALSVERQIPWLNRQLVDELRRSGRAASQLDGDARWAGYGPAYLAIDLLFPGERPAGRLRMPTSQIKTLQAADITVLVPGGGANAGDIAGQTGFKKASDLGIVTVSGGDISTVVRDDFEVNASRVFTLGQGDLLMWSSAGNIDAGRGAKTVTGAPPPVLRLLENGSLVLDASGSFSGSGIAVLGAGSDLDLYAPTGEINAGEAGIRSKGNAFLGAERLVNANDINVAGSRSGAVAEAPLSVPITVPVNDALTQATARGTESARDDDERKRRRARRTLLLEFLVFGSS
ncbi:filamentous haemagglutinin family protein, partial [Paucibacter sp. XJ19-41]|uniref:filamentous haemagglutinin family protein n=1 Tax=Paucibacter sp. XJ19-41 TaxID=2927824 RepID=UPI0023499755